MILVTGATGHLGNVLTRELLSRGEPVRALVPPGEDAAALAGLAVETLAGDLLDPASLDRAFAGMCTVFHLAAAVRLGPGARAFVGRVNLGGTLNVIEACGRAGVKRLVYAGSFGAFSPPPGGRPIAEDASIDPDRALGAYCRSKAAAMRAVLEATRAGLDAVVVCPTGLLGPYDFGPSPLGGWIKDAMAGRLVSRFTLAGGYDLLDVRDAARGFIHARERGGRGGVSILAGEYVTQRQLAALVDEAAGIPRRRLPVPLPLARLAALIAAPVHLALRTANPRLTSTALRLLASPARADDRRTRAALGLAPRPLAESIADTVRWFREQEAPFPPDMK